jgi:hypothetical protein
VLALLAVGQSFTAAEQWNDLRYTDQSALFLVALSLILIGLARQSWLAAPLWKKGEQGKADGSASSG